MRLLQTVATVLLLTSGALTVVAQGTTTKSPVTNATNATNTTTRAPSTTTPPPSTAVPPTTVPSGPPPTVNVIIIGNLGPVAGTDTFQSPNLPAGSYLPYKSDWPGVASTVLNSFRATLASMYPFSIVAPPVLINTQGRIFTALTNLSAAIGAQTPHAVIIIDSYEVSRAIQTSIVQSYGTNIVILMALAASQDVNFASAAVAPATIRVAPPDQNSAATMVSVMNAVAWQAYSIICTSDDYGNNFVASMASATAAAANSPRLLFSTRLVGWAAANRDTLDEAVIVQLASVNAKGVIAAGGPGFAARVINAYLRASAKYNTVAVSGLFFIFTPPAMLDFPQFVPPDRTNGLPFQQHAILSPAYTSRPSLPNFDLTSYAGDGLAFALSYALDSLAVVAAAAQSVFLTGQMLNATSLLAAAQNVNFTNGFTGAVSFDGNNNRLTPAWNLVQMPLNPRDPATVFATYSGAALTTTQLSSQIPQSLLATPQICVVGSASCADFANVNHAVLALLDASAGRVVETGAPKLPTSVTYNVVVISGGTNGFTAISALAQYGTACDVIVGPAKTNLAVAINPIVTYHATPTIDFGSSSPLLSDKISYPYYTRVIQPETSMIAAMSSLFLSYSWGSCGVITTKDAYGSAFLNQMMQSRVFVEKTYLVDTFSSDSGPIAAALGDIRDNLITRIIVVALPASDAVIGLLFSSILALDAKTRSTLIFYFSDAVCQYLAVNPSIRAQLLGSMCAVPAFDANAYAPVFSKLLAKYGATAKSLLTAGGYSTTTCDQSFTDMYSAMAHDAAWVVTDSISRMVAANGGTLATNKGQNVVWQNRSLALKTILNTTFVGATGPLAFTSSGDRLSMSYNFTIQQNGFITVLGTWNPTNGYQAAPQSAKLVWADNTTTTPTYSARGVVFIASHTASANPGVIAISVIGFIVTVGAFVFAYKYHSMKKKVAGIELGDGPSVVNMGAASPAAR